MASSEPIRNLTQLRRRKNELLTELSITRNEMSRGMSATRNEVQSFMVKRIFLPVGAGLLGLIVVSKLLSGKDADPTPANQPEPFTEEEFRRRYVVEPREKSSFNLLQVVRVAVPIVQAAVGFLAGYLKKEEEVQ